MTLDSTRAHVLLVMVDQIVTLWPAQAVSDTGHFALWLATEFCLNTYFHCIANALVFVHQACIGRLGTDLAAKRTPSARRERRGLTLEMLAMRTALNWR